MRLLHTKELDTGNFKIEEFTDHTVPQYAILSHTWEQDEVTFQDMDGDGIRARKKRGFMKIKNCCSLALANGFKYLWIDTCCIDKTSSAELSEAINSMYRWYEEAEVCYAYLADVPSKSRFEDSRWFTRGWTLQELIAPTNVEFLDETWAVLGSKKTLQKALSDQTCIPISILSGDDDLEIFSIAQKMSWAAKRETSRIEDRAYSLMGLFGVNMPLIYGEKETAFIRLQEEIMRISDDHTLFAWKHTDNRAGLLATSPAAFTSSHNIVQFNPFDSLGNPPTMSSRGIHLELPLIGIGPRGLGLAILHCKERHEEDRLVTIYVKDISLTMERFERVESANLEQVDLKRFRPSQYPVRRICVYAGRMTRKGKKTPKKEDTSAREHTYSSDQLSHIMKIEDSAALPNAASAGNEDVVWLLLTRSDIRTDAKDKVGRTSLSLAAEKGHKAIVNLLLHRGAAIDMVDKSGHTPLLWAAKNGHEAAVMLLLDRGATIDVVDRFSQTPLSWASENGHEAVVELLLERGATVDTKDMNNQTPVSWAARKGYKAIVRLLLDRGAKIDMVDRFCYTPLSWAAEKGHEAVIKLLLERGAAIDVVDKSGHTPLSWAAGTGHKAIVELLLERGATVDTKDVNNQTPLSRAAGKGGATINVVDQFGQTPLSWAAEKGHEAVIKLLLERGAAVNVGS
ncbi:ankyrin repeat-containing domain protein [Aspergillus ambiguus]|uniref:ankyrin repeat-containing domain protein n=1 Tax=Aspergillus ambiguus TaxID=176160 RepID=UPI003CCCC2E0